MRYSKFSHILKKNGMVCLYNALNMDAYYFTDDEFRDFERKFNSNDLSDYKKLISSKILVEDNFDEESYLKLLNDEIFDGVQVRVMVLHMTDYCNLRCKYCFIEGNISNDYCRNRMSPIVAQKAVDKFIQVLKDYKKKARPSIVFYGGEPLDNWKTILQTLEYIDNQKKIDVDKILITNGTLITDEIAKKLKLHHVHVSISIDGNKERNDVNRVFINGQGSFEFAKRGIDILREHNLEPSISCVLSKENVNHAEEIIDYFAKDLKIKALGFNHVSIVPDQNYYDEDYENNFADSLLKVQERIQEKYPYIYERRMNHKINCFLDKKLLRADCTGCGEQMSVSPTGEIGICQGYMGSRKTFNNSVFDDKYLPKEDPVFIEWSKRSPLTMKKCLDCVALATCGGGCPRNADVLLGSIWERDLPFCHFAKKAQEWLIWKTIKK